MRATDKGQVAEASAQQAQQLEAHLFPTAGRIRRAGSKGICTASAAAWGAAWDRLCAGAGRG